MTAKWTGEVVGAMHSYGITAKSLAEYLGYCPEYVSMILNGKREPKGTEERFRKALKEIVDSSEQDHSNTSDVQ